MKRKRKNDELRPCRDFIIVVYSLVFILICTITLQVGVVAWQYFN